MERHQGVVQAQQAKKNKPTQEDVALAAEGLGLSEQPPEFRYADAQVTPKKRPQHSHPLSGEKPSRKEGQCGPAVKLETGSAEAPKRRLMACVHCVIVFASKCLHDVQKKASPSNGVELFLLCLV